MALIADFIRRLFERKEKTITFYNTYGYREGAGADAWTIPVRIWVHKRRPVSLEVVAWRVKHKLQADLDEPLKDEQVARLKACLADFVADDDSRERVELVFDEDAGGKPFTPRRRTNLNGLIEEEIKLPVHKAQELLARQGSKSGWLTLTARSGGFQGKGRVRLIEPEGFSVVSDIDDTIKVTEVPAGKKPVLRRTFLQDYEDAPGMRDRYLQIRAAHPDVSFHYVSGSPWQLYGLLQQFLINETGFPEGTFHMKSLRKNLFDRESWHDIRNFVIAGEAVTLEQKIEQITALMLNLPQRKFILIGDSGEKDPEVYRAMAGLFPGQVEEIRIRDVLGERLTENVGHLSINIIPAKTVFFETSRIAEKKKAEALKAKEKRVLRI